MAWAPSAKATVGPIPEVGIVQEPSVTISNLFCDTYSLVWLTMPRKTYPSDITREQFAVIRPLLESAKKKTKPRKHDLYDIFCALLYIVKSCCQWDMLPSDFPHYKTVRYYFRVWGKRQDQRASSVLEESLKKWSNTSVYAVAEAPQPARVLLMLRV